MNLEPEMPEGVEVVRGELFHRVIVDPDRRITTWIPNNAQAMARLRAVISRLIFESEQGARGALPSAVSKTAATVFLFLIALLFVLCPSSAHAQDVGTFIRLVDTIGKVNAKLRERPASELSKPCRVGDRIKVEGVWYDCKSRGQVSEVGGQTGGTITRLRFAKECPPNCECIPARNPYDSNESAVAIVKCGVTPKLETARDRLYRSRLSEAAAQPPNFMRHWVLSYWGCGMDCLMGAAVDTQSGRVVWLPFYLTDWAVLESPYPPLVFSKRNGTVIIPRGILIFDRGSGYAPQTWRLFRGRFIRKAARR